MKKITKDEHFGITFAIGASWVISFITALAVGMKGKTETTGPIFHTETFLSVLGAGMVIGTLSVLVFFLLYFLTKPEENDSSI